MMWQTDIHTYVQHIRRAVGWKIMCAARCGATRRVRLRLRVRGQCCYGCWHGVACDRCRAVTAPHQRRRCRRPPWIVCRWTPVVASSPRLAVLRPRARVLATHCRVAASRRCRCPASLLSHVSPPLALRPPAVSRAPRGGVALNGCRRPYRQCATGDRTPVSPRCCLPRCCLG